MNKVNNYVGAAIAAGLFLNAAIVLANLLKPAPAYADTNEPQHVFVDGWRIPYGSNSIPVKIVGQNQILLVDQQTPVKFKH
jgi:hypothetical protein